jgi:phosphoglucomutase
MLVWRREKPMKTNPIEPLAGQAKAGLERVAVSPDVAEAALRNLERWLDAPPFRDYVPQLLWLMEQQKWGVLLDSFYRVLPFGTGGRRGPVGIGTNRFNPFTLLSTVRGHVAYLQKRYPGKALSVVLAYDVREFRDIRGIYNPDVENPLSGMTSRKFAQEAAGVYAANGVRVYILPPDSKLYVSTPELSYLIRRLGAEGGLNISASHNHPDDNGGKFFGETGGQEVPPQDEELAKEAEAVEEFTSLTMQQAQVGGHLQWIDERLHQEYIDLNLSQSLDTTARNARVVFTPLHGVGEMTVGQLLRQAGFQVEPVGEQSRPDGSFPSVPFRAPNPEVRESMAAGIEVGRQLHADLVMACDPDADRIGLCSSIGNDDFRFLTGNEIAVLTAHYKLEMLRSLNRLPKRPVVIKTEVTTELLRAITREFGGYIIGDLLVGFKYHADVLHHLETEGRYKDLQATLDDFVIAVEESHGVLVTHHLRDKDAAGPAILLAELAARLGAQNRTLADYLDDIYLRYGYHANHVSSMVMSGAEGTSNIATIQSALRRNPPRAIAGFMVTEIVDHQSESVRGPKLSETDWASRDVLVFKLGDTARAIVRPSGTEPKNKAYVEVRSEPLGARAGAQALAGKKAETNAIAQRIADDFTLHMLRIIGIELPAYALRISGLVPLDRRTSFSREFIPGLEERASNGELSDEAVGQWIDQGLRSYGEDARGLVRDAVRTYVEQERKGAGADRMKCLDRIAAFF